ncbi:MAG TPA: hypothetical protein VFS88_08610 [Micavibrio sp.]|nr:hypothetical protein [Micavibrio sp.]
MADAAALRQFREDRLRVIDAKSAGRFLYLSFLDAADDDAAEAEFSVVQTMELDCVTEKEALSNMKKLLKARAKFSP